MIIRIFTFVIFLFFANFTYSQENPIVVKRSTEKVFENGRKFYLHTVQKGETLYSISKAYNIETKDIAMENADVFNGLQPDKILRIPIIVGKNSTEEEILSAGKYIVHKVEPQQTLYSISKQYETSVTAIQELNPEVLSGVRIGQLLRIPKKDEIVETKQAISNSNDYINHVVEKSQTLYSVSKKYNVSIESILKENPTVSEEGLKAGSIIRIPKSDNSDIIDEAFTNQKSKTENAEITTTVADIDVDIFDTDLKPIETSIKSSKNKSINISVLLPLYADRNNKIDIESVVKGSDAMFPNSHFIQFYEGILIAVDSLRRKGMNIILNIYDTENDSAKIVSLLKNPELKKSDLLIGPAYIDEFKTFSEFAKQNHIPIVSPFLSKQEIIQSNPYVFQLIPSLSEQLNLSINKIFNAYKTKNLIFITNSNIEKDKMAQLYRKTLDTLSKQANKNVKIISSSYFNLSQIEPELSLTDENILFVPSTDQVYVSNLISTIGIYGKKYNISIIGLPNWKKYDNIELEYFHRTNLHIFQPVFVNCKDDNIKKIVKESHFLFKNEPKDPYTYLGYDVAMYFSEAINEFGPSFVNKIQNLKKHGVCIDFNFVRKQNSNGFENNSVKILKYNNDFDIIRFE